MPAKRFTFPKNRRLARGAQFQRVKEKGQTHRGQFIVLSVVQANGNSFRAGFVTSRTIGAATARNRVRRRLREVVRKHQHEIVGGTWIVTIARLAAVSASYQQLEGEWLRLARRASILTA
jgi:ribonuclease P protein component